MPAVTRRESHPEPGADRPKLRRFAPPVAVPATFAFSLMDAGLDSAVGAQQALYQACPDAQRTDCRPDFGMRVVLTPESVGALIAPGAVAPVPVEHLRGARAGEPG